jgi:ubiquinone/menaquinone biosynthesis C-methylase UbiE
VSDASTAELDSQTVRGKHVPGADGSRPVSVAEGYERWAPTYDGASNPLLIREERHLLPRLTGVRNKSVLDLACGTGRWLENLMAQGIESGIGIDSSAAMLQIGERKSAIRRRLTRATCESLPFLNATFDFAICSFAVGHVCDLQSMTGELARVTKPGAEVFISDLHPQAFAQGWRVGFRDGRESVHIEMRSRSVEEIVNQFCSNGFDCLTHESLWLGDPERSIFEIAGKSHFFADACRLPAVLICQFKRLASATHYRSCLPHMSEARR